MRRLFILGVTIAGAVATATLGFGSAGVEASPTARPLTTGFLDPPSFTGPERAAAFANARGAGASVVRIQLPWVQVAPTGATKPAGFNARNPADPHYVWGALDDNIRATVANGFAPLIYVETAPVWAQDGGRAGAAPVRPGAAALADFFTALARRYSGSYRGLPRVRYWQVWNEPNLSIQLLPQSVAGNAVSPEMYRAMVNAVARAVHAVRRDNVVVAGGLAPFGGNMNDPSGGIVEGQERIRPLQFMREMLCMSRGTRPKPTCKARAEFDVWAHHPYTYGGPTHSAFHPDDVSMGDLGEMKRLLDAAVRAKKIQSRQKVGFWVTEFSYDSRPGDPNGLPLELHARWTSEALYRMWRNGVSHVTWFMLRDEAFPQGMFQSGMYIRGANGIASDEPKPTLQAFRFPFVAFSDPTGSVSFWGRTPRGVRTPVVVEQLQDGEWRRVATPAVDRYGIFQGKTAPLVSPGQLRAQIVTGDETSHPFSLEPPADFRFCPWGSFC